MVSEWSIAHLSDKSDKYQIETCSTKSSIKNEYDDEDDDDLECDGAIVLNGDKDYTSFGNICVTNSNDVHFGHKTFYQGPVTIKQILYTKDKDKIDDPDGIVKKEIILDPVTAAKTGVDNPGFILNNIQNNSKTESTIKPVEAETGNRIIKDLKKLYKKKCILVSGLLILFIVILTALLSIFLTKPSILPDNNSIIEDSNEQEKVHPVASPIDPSINLTLSSKLKLVSRLEWLAQPPVKEANRLPLPVEYVIVSHTATENCSSQAQCIFLVRYTQTFHIESRGWWDIGYNFLVGGDGEAYEGRGWNSEGAHTYGYNSRSIGISFIGTFNSIEPPDRQIKAFELLVNKGVEIGALKKDFKILAARQLQTTQSPGEALYKRMKTWNHWAAEP